MWNLFFKNKSKVVKGFLALRLFFFSFFTMFLIHCDSQWDDDFLRSSQVKICTEELVTEIMTETFLNAKALTTGIKSTQKQFVEFRCPHPMKAEVILSKPFKVADYICTTAAFCAVRSYLHLLQFF